ncbi:hypothetical protein R1sor_000259 [Riccia sorocarpa]|uniref:Uncharacterized protein n=1 Tax=Riccia sorocarpa TaxID=122646 RepID=A0ABD3GVN0_9MARC
MSSSCVADFLDHFATVQWAFTIKDTRFIATPESSVIVQDSGIFQSGSLQKPQNVHYASITSKELEGTFCLGLYGFKDLLKERNVCNKTATMYCGQTLENPKLIPSLPFYYVDDTSRCVEALSLNSGTSALVVVVVGLEGSHKFALS